MGNIGKKGFRAKREPVESEKPLSTIFSDSDDSRREKLVALGADQLADALLKLSSHDNGAELVERLISSHSDKHKLFHRRLESVHRRETYYEWNATPDFIEYLDDSLLGPIEDIAPPSRDALEALVALFEADADICESCHDDGEIGMFYQINVCDLFVRHAAVYDDKPWLIDVVLKLNAQDNYGCRAFLFDHVAEFLPEPHIGSLVDKMWKLAKGKDRAHWLCGLKSIGKRLADPDLLEKAWNAHCPDGLPDNAIFELVEVWLAKGAAAKAKAYLSRASRKDDYRHRELLEKIHRSLGETEELAALLRRQFSLCRSAENLENLLKVVGEDQRSQIIAEEAEAIAAAKEFNEHDTTFLLSAGLDEAAVGHVLKHAGKIDGHMYFALEPLARAFAKLGHPLPAIVLYRAMVDATLEAKKSKYYHHAVSHLREIQRLAPTVHDWSGLQSQSAYLNALRQAHSRKSGFWSQL